MALKPVRGEGGNLRREREKRRKPRWRERKKERFGDSIDTEKKIDGRERKER